MSDRPHDDRLRERLKRLTSLPDPPRCWRRPSLRMRRDGRRSRAGAGNGTRRARDARVCRLVLDHQTSRAIPTPASAPPHVDRTAGDRRAPDMQEHTSSSQVSRAIATGLEGAFSSASTAVGMPPEIEKPAWLARRPGAKPCQRLRLPESCDGEHGIAPGLVPTRGCVLDTPHIANL